MAVDRYSSIGIATRYVLPVCEWRHFYTQWPRTGDAARAYTQSQWAALDGESIM